MGREIWGIEVKASRDVSRRDCAALGSFAEATRGVTRQIVVFQGPRRQQLDRVEAIPILELLKELPR